MSISNKTALLEATKQLDTPKRMEINFADSSQYSSVVERFGGDELLKKQFPRIRQMIDDTRKYEIIRAEREINGAAPILAADSRIYGRKDLFDVELLKAPLQEAAPKKGLETLFARSRANYLEEKPFIMLQSHLVEKASAKFLGGYTKYVYNSCIGEGTFAVDPSILLACEKRDISLTTTFQAVEQTPEGIYVLNETVRSTNVFMLSGTYENEAIKSITLIHPKEKPGADKIKIVYDNRNDANAAYIHPNARSFRVGNTHYVDVILPLGGIVEFANDFTVAGANPFCFDETFMCRLTGTRLTGGVEFNPANWNQIELKKLNKTALSWRFPDNWGCAMALSDYAVDGLFDLYFRPYVNVVMDALGVPFQIPFIVTSENIIESPSYHKIKQLYIVWGCLGRRSEIMMADGSLKAIAELKPGDKIRSQDGKPVAVQNIISGSEKTMILVQGAGQKPLLLSDAHPIVTQRGIIMASALNAADMLFSKEGAFIPIVHLERVAYNDKVYSLQLETPGTHFAQGVAVGDYQTTTSPPKIKRSEPMDRELKAQLEEWSEMMDKQYRSWAGS